jgi:hypothetical protein
VSLVRPEPAPIGGCKNVDYDFQPATPTVSIADEPVRGTGQRVVAVSQCLRQTGIGDHLGRHTEVRVGGLTQRYLVRNAVQSRQ